MALRNFWVEVEIAGRKTKLKGGPAKRLGGMKITLYQRDKGTIHKSVTVDCEADAVGNLMTTVQAYQPGFKLTNEMTYVDTVR